MKRAFLVLVLGVIVGQSARAQNMFSFMTNGLVAYYPFKGNPRDDSGNGDNGQTFGVTLTSDRFGNPDAAFHFSTTNSGSILTPGSNLPTGAAPRTVSLWFKADIVNVFPAHESLVGYGTTNTDEGFVLYIQSDGLGLDISGGGYFAPLNNQGWFPNHSIYFFDGKWHCMVAVVTYLSPDETGQGSGGNQLGGYFDGKLLNVAVSWPPIIINSGLATTKTPPSALIIGGNFSGAISDVRVYDRALAADEVAALFAIESTPLPQIEVTKAIRIDMAVALGKTYRFSTSTNLKTWTYYGNPFTPSTTVESTYFTVENYNQYFELLEDY